MFGTDGRVAAVLDWELSTLGHPLADLAYSAMPYHLPSGTPALPSLPNPLPPGALLLGVWSHLGSNTLPRSESHTFLFASSIAAP